ncbi:hypothetical protein DXG03_000112 [Asterophora parasitica]|uniref:Mitochondrial distribution and morphology protein 34 n=1 Tax=Asterophora parasitica TaxID=117018 RepID=A0A9P7KGL4_9AGAR|nr:hypothetical protein DXG03_000112 [Asterophora parasitica]
MSFTFNWPRFSDQFHFDAIQMLNTALNKGNKPPIIADRIEVVELEMGTQPPELEIRDIGDLTVDQFRGIFRLTYSGDAHLVLKTKVQANPLNHKQPDIHLMAGSRGMLAAKQPLVVPMLLRLSHFKLNSYVVLVVSKQKGITLVFKTDPLQSVDINSTFDSIAVIQKFIQREIEGQLRQMFREDLPGIIHRLSQQWVKAKVEAPYLQKHTPPLTSRKQHTSDTHSVAGMSMKSMPPPIFNGNPPMGPRRPQSVTSARSYSYPTRPRSTSGYSASSISKPKSPKTPPPPIPSEPVSFPDLENFDPTYGLRPEGLPTKSVFRGFSELFTPNKGLADLAEDSEEEDDFDDDDGAASFDIVNWDYTLPDSNTSIYDDAPESLAPDSEYETIPAVGGGTITRPRIYHSQSMIQPTFGQTNAIVSSSKYKPSLSSYGSIVSPRSGFTTPGLVSRHPGGMFRPYPGGLSSAHSVTSGFRTAPPFTSPPRRPVTPDSLETQPSRSSSGRGLSTSTPPTEHPVHDDDDDYHDSRHDSAMYMRRPPPLPSSTAPSSRRPSISSSSNLEHAFPSTSPTISNHDSSNHTSSTHNPKIVLRPSLNNSIHQLSTLSHSNHTLSPYTRNLQHFTVRSVPPRSAAPSGGFQSSIDRQPVKAKRKRIFRLGGMPKRDAAAVAADEKTKSRRPPLPRHEGQDLDLADMDRYFRTRDELESLDGHSQANHPVHLHHLR